MDRRTFLRAAPVLALAAAPAAAAEPERTPLERLAKAQDELIAASKIAFPEVTDWRVMLPEDDDVGMPYMFMVVGHNWEAKRRKTVKVHVDDGWPLLADDVTGTTAYADWERSQNRA